MLDLLKKNRIAAIAAAVVVLAFVGLSVMRCTAVHAPEPVQEQGESQDGERQEGASPAADGEGSPEALPADIAAIRSAYDEETREVDAFLAANAWTSAGDASTLSFADSRLLEEKPGQQSVSAPYAIAALSRDNAQEKTQAGATIKRTSIAVKTPERTHLLLLTETTDPAGGVSWIIASDTAFKHARAYNRAAASAAFSVEGLSAEAVAMFGNDMNAITSKLNDYCAQYFPTASRATWTAQATIDWAEGVADTSFTLDNSSKTQITLTYRMDGQSLEVGKVR